MEFFQFGAELSGNSSIEPAIEQAKSDLGRKQRPSLKWLSWSGVCVGAFFCVFNFVTCTFRGDVPFVGDVYSSTNVFVLEQGMKVERTFTEKVAIPKWDTDPGEAPVTWALARVWVLFGYGLIPVVLAKVLNLMVVLRSFSTTLLLANPSLKLQALSPEHTFEELKETSPAFSAGLISLSSVAVRLAYLGIPVSLMTAASWLKEATPPSLHNHALLYIALPLVLITFFFPMSSMASAVIALKHRYLNRIASRFRDLNERLLTLESAEPQAPKRKAETMEELKYLKELHTVVAQARVWPVVIHRTGRVVGPLLGSLAVPLFLRLWDSL